MVLSVVDDAMLALIDSADNISSVSHIHMLVYIYIKLISFIIQLSNKMLVSFTQNCYLERKIECTEMLTIYRESICPLRTEMQLLFTRISLKI